MGGKQNQKSMVKNALNKAFAIARPKILNSDQYSQFTSHDYINYKFYIYK